MNFMKKKSVSFNRTLKRSLHERFGEIPLKNFLDVYLT